MHVTHTFEELVEKQQVADQAHAQVLALGDEYGPPTQGGWTDEQTAAYDEAWKAWRDAAEVQAAVTEYATAEGKARHHVEADVKQQARHPELAGK